MPYIEWTCAWVPTKIRMFSKTKNKPRRPFSNHWSASSNAVGFRDVYPAFLFRICLHSHDGSMDERYIYPHFTIKINLNVGWQKTWLSHGSVMGLNFFSKQHFLRQASQALLTTWRGDWSLGKGYISIRPGILGAFRTPLGELGESKPSWPGHGVGWQPEIRQAHQFRLVVEIPLFSQRFFIHPRWLFGSSSINCISPTWNFPEIRGFISLRRRYLLGILVVWSHYNLNK